MDELQALINLETALDQSKIFRNNDITNAIYLSNVPSNVSDIFGMGRMLQKVV